MEFYNEIHGAPIFDVYDDEEPSMAVRVEATKEEYFAIYDGEPIIDMYDENLEVCLREVKNEFQNFKLGMAEIIRSFEESVNRLLEAAIRNISARGRARGGNAQRSERSNATSHHTSRTKTPQTEKKRRTTRTTAKGATKTTKKFTPTGRGIKKLHRHHIRTIVLCEIRNYQRITKLLICKLPFQRLVHDRGRHRNFPMKHSSDLPRQPSHNMLGWSLVQTRFLRQCVNHGCYHESNKKLLEFGVGGFTHKSMNFGDKVLLDGGVMMRYYLRKKMTWPRGLVILISSGDVVRCPRSLVRDHLSKKLDDLKTLFASLASQSQSNDQYVSYPAFQAYFGLSGSLGERIFDMVTQHRKDDKMTFEDLVIAKATYEKGTDDDIAEFIYQTLDVNGNGLLTRSDLESVLVVILKSVFSTESSDAESSDYTDMVDALLNAATFSKSDDASEKGMAFQDFRSWCSLVPTVRKFLGSLLMPPGPVRPGYQVPHLLYDDGVGSDRLLLKKEYAWHIGGALPHHELEEWKLLYHSSLHGQSFNTFLGHTSNTGMSASVLIIKDKEGCVFGGYASQPWERYSDFYGDMKSFLFQLNPKAAIFRPTGANTNIQWCATNFTSENIPNGIGFGGKINHFGLFISANFDQGQTFSCTTFGSPSLSKTSRIQPEVIECWGIVQASNELDSQHNAMKGTVLERFKEDRNMLKLVGMAGNSND